MRINHVVKVIIASDFYIEGGLVLFSPIFAVFVTDQIMGGSLEVVGFAAAITQIVIFEIPIAKYLDRNHGEYDDFYSMLLGSALISLTPFLYLFASLPNHIYLIHIIGGLGLAFFIPPRYAIFSRHIDKLQENLEWSFKSVVIGVAMAGAAALGGFMAQRFGFNSVFVLGGILAVIGSIYEVKIFKDLKEKVPRGIVRPVPGK
jgi:MFS family permease